jgi:hypothetical protein
MDMLNQILNINNDVLGIIKVIVALSGFLALTIKLKEAFSDKQRKEKLKTDLDILEISKNIVSIRTEQIQNKIETEVSYLYDENRVTSNEIYNFILGLIITVGFSFWSINIFQNSDGFNPWVILTMFIAGTGMMMFFDDKKKRDSKGEFFRIEFHDNSTLKVSLITGIISLISFISLIIIYKSFIWWLFVAALFILISFRMFLQNVKLKAIKTG